MKLSDYLSKIHNSKVYIKEEWHNSTGSHKDRSAKKALEKMDGGRIVVASSGNLGLAYAAEAKKRDIECVIISFTSLLPSYIKKIKKLGAKLILAKTEEERDEEFDKYVNLGYSPLTLTPAGQETKEGVAAYEKISDEILKDLGKSPDLIIVPTCYGDLALGVLNGFKGEKIPKFLLARQKETGDSMAYSINSNITTPNIKKVIEETKGKSIFLKNEDLEAAMKIAKEHLGISLESASASSIAALSYLTEKEKEGKTIVLILTALSRE